jgi:D-arabinose 1-dehydrogenase-like Zn-dependent alcohol dehydrogenase
MRSYQIVEWGEALEKRDTETPEPQGAEVLVRVSACGVCHSDIHIWDGYFDLGGGRRITLGDRGVDLPFTMGHEVVGVVAALGPEVDGVEVGDRRVVFPWIGCGTCKVCLRDEELLCLNPRTVGTRKPGGYADHVIVPHARYLLDYEGIPTELACTYACSGITAYRALKETGAFGEDDDIVIIGAGGVGLSAVHLAPNLIKGKIIVADVDAEKRSIARQSGAHHTVDNSEREALKEIRKLTEGGASAAIDFVGAPATTQFGADAVRKGGTVVSVGLYGGSMPLSLALMPLKMLTIRGSYVGTLEDLREVLALAKAGKVAPIPLDPRPIAKVNDALNDLRAGRVAGRVVLKP